MRRAAFFSANCEKFPANSRISGNLVEETRSHQTASTATDFDSMAAVRPALGLLFGGRSEADLDFIPKLHSRRVCRLARAPAGPVTAAAPTGYVNGLAAGPQNATRGYASDGNRAGNAGLAKAVRRDRRGPRRGVAHRK